MNNHEKLKWICDKIGFNLINYEMKEKLYLMRKVSETCRLWINVREIIFTQEFIYKLKEYLHEVKNQKAEDVVKKTAWILYNLDNPVEYIYNLIKE